MTKTFKIEIENGKPTCPELVGYRLPSFSRSQEDDVEALAEREYREYPSDPKGSNYQNNRDVNCHRKRKAFIKGYHKACERFEFTRQDLIDFAQSLKDYTHESHVILGHDERDAFEFVDVFLSGRNRLPVAIEVEMEYTCCKRYLNCKGCDATEDMIQPIKPATNPDGTVKVLKWIFNE